MWLQAYFRYQPNLSVLDINEIDSEQYSWISYRGNSMRNGFYDISLFELSHYYLKIPQEHSLESNYLNTFNPTTRINYSLSKIVISN